MHMHCGNLTCDRKPHCEYVTAILKGHPGRLAHGHSRGALHQHPQAVGHSYSARNSLCNKSKECEELPVCTLTASAAGPNPETPDTRVQASLAGQQALQRRARARHARLQPLPRQPEAQRRAPPHVHMRQRQRAPRRRGRRARAALQAPTRGVPAAPRVPLPGLQPRCPGLAGARGRGQRLGGPRSRAAGGASCLAARLSACAGQQGGREPRGGERSQALKRAPQPWGCQGRRRGRGLRLGGRRGRRRRGGSARLVQDARQESAAAEHVRGLSFGTAGAPARCAVAGPRTLERGAEGGVRCGGGGPRRGCAGLQRVRDAARPERARAAARADAAQRAGRARQQRRAVLLQPLLRVRTRQRESGPAVAQIVCTHQRPATPPPATPPSSSGLLLLCYRTWRGTAAAR